MVSDKTSVVRFMSETNLGKQQSEMINGKMLLKIQMWTISKVSKNRRLLAGQFIPPHSIATTIDTLLSECQLVCLMTNFQSQLKASASTCQYK